VRRSQRLWRDPDAIRLLLHGRRRGLQLKAEDSIESGRRPFDLDGARDVD